MKGHSLDDRISEVLAPKVAWDGLKAFCDDNISKLQGQLCGGKSGGMLFSEGRKTRELGKWLRAQVNKKNLHREVGLSYAVFNTRERPLIRGYRIISWEAPLLRPETGRSDTREVSCDLVAYKRQKKQLVAVEVKIRSEQAATKMQHGLLQAMVYGHILQHYVAENCSELERQVRDCLNHWYHENTPSSQVEGVSYALAAPKEYFVESLRMYGREGLDWMRRAIRLVDVPFDGFWVLDYDQVTSMEDQGTQCVPIVDCSVNRILSVNTLAEYCRKA